MRRPPSSALKDRLQQLGPNEVIINHWASCFELVCRFSSGLCVHRLIDILCCPCYFHSMLWGVCVFNVTDMLPSMFHLHFQCFYWVLLRNNRKQNPIYAASVIANTFSPLIHLSFTYTSALSVSLSLPAGVRFLCKAAWMSMEIRVLSVLLIHFSLWSFPSSQEQGPQSQTRVRALDASARTMAGRGGGVRGLGSIDGQGYVLSGSLAAFAFFCFVVTRKRKRYGSLLKRTIHTWEITRLGRDGALK